MAEMLAANPVMENLLPGGSLIPLAIDEEYRVGFGPGAGLELSFSKRSR